jgi:hypothetical protein
MADGSATSSERVEILVTTILFGLPTGQRLLHTRLTLACTTLRVRELIAHKVQQEVAEYAAQQRPGLSGEFLAPEVLLRAAASPTFVPGELAAEIARAQAAFVAREYMIVVNNRRLFAPEEILTLKPQMQIEFIKILPLVGG